MAPAVSTSRKSDAAKADPQKAMQEIAGKIRSHISKNFDYVGENFASEARAMHSGEKPEKPIYGETTAEESKSLADDGVPCAPLPDPFVPPQAKKLN